MWMSPPLHELSNRFLVDRQWPLLGHVVATQRFVAQQGRVADALAELHVIGGRPMLVDVHALELSVLVEAEVPRALDGLYGVHDQERGAEQHHHTCGDPEAL